MKTVMENKGLGLWCNKLRNAEFLSKTHSQARLVRMKKKRERKKDKTLSSTAQDAAKEALSRPGRCSEALGNRALVGALKWRAQGGKNMRPRTSP